MPPSGRAPSVHLADLSHGGRNHHEHDPDRRRRVDAIRGRDRLRQPPRRRLQRSRRRGLRVPVQRCRSATGREARIAKPSPTQAEKTAGDMRDRLEGIAADRSADQDHAPIPRRRMRSTTSRKPSTPSSWSSAHRTPGGWDGSHRAAPASGCCTALRAPSRSSPTATAARTEQPIRRIGVAYDGSDEATAAVAAAVALARALSARELEIIGVVAPERYEPSGHDGRRGLTVTPQDELDQLRPGRPRRR